MAVMGRPDMVNPFGNITKAPGQNTGDALNKMAGIKEGRKFVDAKTHNKLGKDDFLKLLTNQLAHQDPMNPMDQSKFGADLAQFSQLEQMSNMNTTLTQMKENAPAENKFYGASFLGKEVLTSGTNLDLKNDGDSKEVPFNLPKDAKNLIIRITDAKGQLAKQIDLENYNRGSHLVKWDGIATDGNPATKGAYNVAVLAWDESQMPFQGETKSTGMVTGVTFENGETILELDRQKRVFLRDVDSFKIPDKIKNEEAVKQQALNAYSKINEGTN